MRHEDQSVISYFQVMEFLASNRQFLCLATVSFRWVPMRHWTCHQALLSANYFCVNTLFKELEQCFFCAHQTENKINYIWRTDYWKNTVPTVSYSSSARLCYWAILFVHRLRCQWLLFDYCALNCIRSEIFFDGSVKNLHLRRCGNFSICITCSNDMKLYRKYCSWQWRVFEVCVCLFSYHLSGDLWKIL